MATWRLQIAFDPEFQPRQHAILDFIAVSLVIAETAFRFVEGGLAKMLEFQLAKLDNRRADFQVVGMRLRRDREKQQRRCHKSLAPHEFPLFESAIYSQIAAKIFCEAAPLLRNQKATVIRLEIVIELVASGLQRADIDCPGRAGWYDLFATQRVAFEFSGPLLLARGGQLDLGPGRHPNFDWRKPAIADRDQRLLLGKRRCCNTDQKRRQHGSVHGARSCD